MTTQKRTLDDVIREATERFQKELVLQTHQLPSEEHRKNVLFRRFDLGMSSTTGKTKKARENVNKTASRAKTDHYGNVQKRANASTKTVGNSGVPLPPYVQGTIKLMVEDYGFTTKQAKRFGKLCGTQESYAKVIGRFERVPSKVKQLPECKVYLNSYHEQLRPICNKKNK